MADDIAPRAFTPKWLSPTDVKTWLRLHGDDTTDDTIVTAAVASAEPYAERCRPEWRTTDATTGDSSYTPDDETYLGAVMVAAREYRRRNSPAGIETFGETTSYVARWDPDIDRLLQTGDYARPVVS